MKSLFWLLAITTALSTMARADAELIRVQVTPSWSIAIPRTFQKLPQDEAWQATGEQGTIYVSSMLVSQGRESDATTVEKLTAELSSFNLKGFMMAKGRVVVCVVTYADRKQQSWAADTWRSLRLSP